tara:strand:- start:35 stop:286 length:252 start_codon:yes stop_codon:yes gene_type:complete
MEEGLNQLTLIGRTEIKGGKYPIYLERLGLFFSISLTIFVTIYIWNNLDWPTWINLLFSICFAPIIALSLAEIIGRIIQLIYN